MVPAQAVIGRERMVIGAEVRGIVLDLQSKRKLYHVFCR